MWDNKKKSMSQDSFSYKVLKDVIEDDPFHHYSIIERHALKKMCIFMDKVESRGIPSITLREFYNMEVNFKIAKMVNAKKMKFFEDEYHTELDSYSSSRCNIKRLLLKI